MGKSTINEPCSIAMLNYQRVSMLDSLELPAFFLALLKLNRETTDLHGLLAAFPVV